LIATIAMPSRAHEFVNFPSHDAAFSGVCVMSDVANTPLKPNAKRDTRTDNQAFAQVEKWMAMIREIDREPQPQRKHAD
jgi:hypothetical protein